MHNARRLGTGFFNSSLEILAEPQRDPLVCSLTDSPRPFAMLAFTQITASSWAPGLAAAPRVAPSRSAVSMDASNPVVIGLAADSGCGKRARAPHDGSAGILFTAWASSSLK